MSPDLLPDNSTAFERALSDATVRLQEVPVPLRLLTQPYLIPSSFLPLLAWQHSVDIWRPAWAEATQRAITARSIELHRHKGTAWLIRQYARYVGGEAGTITTPPQRIFSGASLTREAREAWLARLPQVRVWRIQEVGFFGPPKAFLGGKHHAMFVERSYPVPSTALSRLHRRARWVVNQAETDVTVTDFGNYYRLHLVGAERRGVFTKRPMGTGYFRPSDAWRRLVTIAPETRMPWRFPIGPSSLRAIQAEPERVVVPGTRGRSVFCNLPCRSGYLVPTTAPLRIYQRYPVVDGTGPQRRAAVQIMGTGYYGWPRHTAMVRMSIPGKRPWWAAGEGIVAPRSKFWRPHDSEPVQTMCRAMQAAKRLSDRVLLQIGPTHRFVAGIPFFADVDSFVVGRP